MSEKQRALVESFVVVRAQTGDDSAFEALYERYNDRLLYYLRRLMGASGAAEDTAQSVWLTVYRSLKTLEQPGAFRTWLYRIAHNQAVSALRISGREVPWQEEADSEVAAVDDWAAGSPADRAAGRAVDVDEFDAVEAADVHAGLDRISGPHREALTLRFLHEMSYDDIADVTGVAVGTVRSRLHHAKRALRRELERTLSISLKGARR